MAQDVRDVKMSDPVRSDVRRSRREHVGRLKQYWSGREVRIAEELPVPKLVVRRWPARTDSVNKCFSANVIVRPCSLCVNHSF